jgi:hypothetical protein
LDPSHFTDNVLVFVDDGETGEVTVLAVRAKMYQLENKETGWKERGAGMLKINVPDSCISWDDSGQPIPGSFDASGLEDEDEEEEEDDEGDEGATESTAAAGSGSGSGGGGARGHKKKSVRLLMRQDHTLRVILNTALTGATEFQERSGLKASSVLFTALFEGQEARPVQMKVGRGDGELCLPARNRFRATTKLTSRWLTNMFARR